MEFKMLHYVVEDAVATITLDYAPTLNALDMNLALELEAALKQAAADFNFISDSLKTAKKFFVSDVTAPWVRKRYEEWKQERGANNTQFSSESDADAFLKPFYSRCNEGFWTEKYANEVSAALPDNSAKNIVVWNPGCGKGFEAYSLACLLKK